MSSRSLTITISTGTVLKIVLVLIATAVLWEIRDILLALFTAMLLAGVMYPFVQRAGRVGIPRWLGVVLFYVVLFGIISLLFALLIPAIVQEAGQFSTLYGDRMQWLHGVIAQIKTLSSSVGVPPDLSAGWASLQGYGQHAFGSVATALSELFGGLVGCVLVLVLSFYLIVEEASIKDFFRLTVPSAYQEVATRMIWQVLEKLGSWLRGQLLLSIVIGVVYGVGLTLFGVPDALLLALLAGLLEFIPYLGPLLAAIPAILLAIGVSSTTAFLTVGFLILVQQLENHFLVPKVMQRAVGLNPVISILAFVVGARLFGIPGAIFAIPIATGVSVAWAEIVRARRTHSS